MIAREGPGARAGPPTRLAVRTFGVVVTRADTVGGVSVSCVVVSCPMGASANPPSLPARHRLIDLRPPDLNPIELCWAFLKQALLAAGTRQPVVGASASLRNHLDLHLLWWLSIRCDLRHQLERGHCSARLVEDKLRQEKPSCAIHRTLSSLPTGHAFRTDVEQLGEVLGLQADCTPHPRKGFAEDGPLACDGRGNGEIGGHKILAPDDLLPVCG